VAHAFATPGAFNVRVTATDGVGNANGADRQVLVTPPPSGGGPPGGGGPPPVPRIDSTVQSNWGFVRRTGRDFFLLRLKVVAPPKGSAAQLRCSGNRCPFQSRRFTKIRKRAITLYANLSPTKATKVKNRRFRAGQLIQIRITAPGYVGKVVEWKLKRGRQPVGVVRCLAPGATRPSAC
jgi:hypothetical protein